MRFPDGQSGNPKGRPKGRGIMDPSKNPFRKFCLGVLPEAQEIFLELLRDRSLDIGYRLRAAMFISEGACGKAPQSMKIEDEHRNLDPYTITTEELNFVIQGEMQKLIASLHKTGKLQGHLEKLEPIPLQIGVVEKDKEAQEVII